MESGLSLGRSALDSLLAELSDKARNMALELSDLPESGRRSAMLRLLEQSGAQSAALFTSGGQLLASANSELGSGLLPALPSQTQLKQARSAFAVTSVDLEGGRMNLRVLVPVTTRGVFEDRRILQLVHPVPPALAQNAEAVQAVYRDYQEL